jgi:sec-independent protein translocase protein TatC
VSDDRPGVNDIEASRAPLVEHLIELRSRLIKSMIAFVLAFVVTYYFSEEIYQFLTQPLAQALGDDPSRRLIYTALQETFFTYIKVAMFGALCLAFPIIAGQMWMFVAPGLYRDERLAFLPFLLATPLLFLLGASLVFYFIMPMATEFFLSFESAGGGGALPIQLEARVSEYLSLVMTLIFAFGLAFQLPVLLMLMGRAGLVSSATLVKQRKYAIVGAFVAAAVLTPPDPISQVGLGVPIILLYEISIIGVRLIERKRADKRAAETGESTA